MVQSDFIFLIFVLISVSNPVDLENLSGLLTFLKQCALHTQLIQLVERETNNLRTAGPVIFVVKRGKI